MQLILLFLQAPQLLISSVKSEALNLSSCMAMGEMNG